MASSCRIGDQEDDEDDDPAEQDDAAEDDDPAGGNVEDEGQQWEVEALSPVMC